MTVFSLHAWIRRLPSLLPRGTGVVGLGVILYGLTSYGFLVLAGRSLGPVRYGSLSAVWALIYVLAPGFFVPVEQEVNRLVASGRRPETALAATIRRSLVLAGLIVLGLSVSAISASSVVLERALEGDVLLLLALIMALAGYAVQHVIRGAVAGLGLFGRYAAILGTEGVIRIGIALILVSTAVSSVGPYGLAIPLAAIVAVLPAISALVHRSTPGPAPRWSELTRSIGLLIMSAVFAQALAAAEPLVVKLLTPSGSEAAGRFLASLVIARIPIFLFQAVQAPFLSRLTDLVTAGRWTEFRSVLRSVLGGVTLAGLGTVLLVAVLGPWIVTTLFGQGFSLSRVNLLVLAGGTACYLVALALAQTLIALSLQHRIVAAWAAGSVAFAARVVIESDIIVRVAQGFLIGSGVAAAMMALSLLRGLGTATLRRQAFPGSLVSEP